MDKKELLEKVKKDFYNQHKFEIPLDQAERITNEIMAKREKEDNVIKQINLIMENRTRQRLKEGMKEHTLRWTIDSMKTVQWSRRFFRDAGLGDNLKIAWKHELSIKKPFDSLRVIMGYWYVRLFYQEEKL